MKYNYNINIEQELQDIFKKTKLCEAGYYGYSKSNNAKEAESENKFPATTAAKKLGVTTEAIKTYIPTSEWHHYSSHYNKIYVYDITPYLMLKNNSNEIHEFYDEDEIEEYKNTYKLMKEFSKQSKSIEEKKYKADVEYIEWSGTRNHPKANINHYSNITVIEKGQYYTFILPNKSIVRKKIGSNGTKVIPMDIIKAQKEKEKILKKQSKELVKLFKTNTSTKALKFIKNNNLDSNSSYTRFYIEGKKPTPIDYNNLSKFFEKGDIRLCSKNPNYLTTAGAYLEQWDGNQWKSIEDNTYLPIDNEEYISIYTIK